MFKMSRSNYYKFSPYCNKDNFFELLTLICDVYKYFGIFFIILKVAIDRREVLTANRFQFNLILIKDSCATYALKKHKLQSRKKR